MIVTQNDPKVRLAAAIAQARRWRINSLMLGILLGMSVLANLYLDRTQGAPSDEDSHRALVKP